MGVAELFDVSGRVALITGGSRGIGYMAAEGLLKAGAKVYICARKQAEIDSAVEKLSEFGQCTGFVADLGTQEGCEAAYRNVAAQEERLNILFNNAGATWSAPLDEFPRAAFDKLLNLNVTGVFELTRLCLPLLRAAVRRGEPARVINVASTAALAPPGSDTFSYSASKSAVVMMTRHLARRLAPEGITANVIAPGVFPSRMTASEIKPDGTHRWNIPLGRIGTPEDMAGTVIYLSSRAAGYLTGVTIPLAGGMTTAD